MKTENDKWLLEETSKAVNEAFIIACKHAGAISLYLYFKRGSIVFAQDCPNGYEIGDNERMPTHIEKTQLFNWAYSRVRRLPCLPIEGAKS
jgi:hypothetical protein